MTDPVAELDGAVVTFSRALDTARQTLRVVVVRLDTGHDQHVWHVWPTGRIERAAHSGFRETRS